MKVRDLSLFSLLTKSKVCRPNWINADVSIPYKTTFQIHSNVEYMHFWTSKEFPSFKDIRFVEYQKLGTNMIVQARNSYKFVYYIFLS